MTLTEYTGKNSITTDGTVIDGKLISNCIEIQARNVVIKNSKITCTGTLLYIRSGSVTVQDSELDGRGIAQTTGGNSNYTLLRVNIHNINEGPRIGDNVVIEDSWIHHLVFTNPEDHQDVLQTTGGRNIVIRHNTLESYNPDERQQHNAAFMVGSEFGALRDMLVEGNLMTGGNYTINIRTDTDAANVRFRNNTFRKVSLYGAVTGHDVSGVTWERNNVWLEDGRAV